jgi:hypothetical protein
MIRRRSAAPIRAQPAISPFVRQQPVQTRPAASRRQIWRHGLSIGRMPDRC